jgi:mycoredoxin
LRTDQHRFHIPNGAGNAAFVYGAAGKYNKEQINISRETCKRAMTSIKIYSTPWCGDCRHAKRFLKDQGIAYEEIDIEQTEGAAEYVMSINNGKRKVPTFEVDGRVFNLSPYNERKLREELGMS